MEMRLQKLLHIWLIITGLVLSIPVASASVEKLPPDSIPIEGYVRYYAYMNFTAEPMKFVKVAGPYGKDSINGTRYFVEDVGLYDGDVLLYNGMELKAGIGSVRYSGYLNFTVPEEWSFIRVSGPYGGDRIRNHRYFVTSVDRSGGLIRIGVPRVWTRGVGADYAWEVEGRQVFVDVVNATNSTGPKYVDISIDGNIYRVTFDGTKEYNTSDGIDELFAGTFVVKEPESNTRATIVYVPEDSQVVLVDGGEALGYAKVHIPGVDANGSLESDRNIVVHLHSRTYIAWEDEIQQFDDTLYVVQYDADNDIFMIRVINGTRDLDGDRDYDDDADIPVLQDRIHYDFVNTSLFGDNDGDGQIYNWYAVVIGSPVTRTLSPVPIPNDSPQLLSIPLPEWWEVEGRLVAVASVNASSRPRYVDLFIDTISRRYRVTFTEDSEYNVSEKIDRMFKGTFAVKKPVSNDRATLLYVPPGSSVVLKDGSPALGYHTTSLYPVAEASRIDVLLKSAQSTVRLGETEPVEGTLYTAGYRAFRLMLRLNGTRDLDGDLDYDDDADIPVIPGRWRYYSFRKTSLFYDTDGDGQIDFRRDGLLYNGVACWGSLLAVAAPPTSRSS